MMEVGYSPMGIWDGRLFPPTQLEGGIAALTAAMSPFQNPELVAHKRGPVGHVIEFPL
jgi:hypothetical protein